MVKFILQNLKFILIISAWMFFGYFNYLTLYPIVPFSLVLLYHNSMIIEMLLGIYLFLVLSDQRVEAITIIGQTFREVYVITLMALLLIYKRFKPFSGLYTYFGAFIVVCVLSSLTSIIAFKSIVKLISYVFVLIITPTYLREAYLANKVATLRALIFFGFFILTVGLVLLVVAPDLVYFSTKGHGATTRYKGVLGNPNGLGIFLLLFYILYNIIVFYHKDIVSKTLHYIISGSIWLSLLLTESRGALFSVIIFAFFSRVAQKSRPLAVFSVIILVIFYQLVLTNFVSFASSLGLGEYFRLESLENGSGRLVAYTFALEHLKDNFFIGGGLGYTEYLFSNKEFTYFLSKRGHQGNAHNSYLTIWLDSGIIGLVFFLYGWGRLFTRAMRTSHFPFPIMLAVFFSSFFESWLAGSLNPYTIILLFIVSLLSNPDFTLMSNENEDFYEEQEQEIPEEPLQLEPAT